MGFDLELFARYKATGDTRLENKIIQDNEKLAVSRIVALCRSAGIPVVDDLLQAGRIGMLIALRKYDPERGTFGNFARHWILDQFQQTVMHLNRTIYRSRSNIMPGGLLKKAEKIEAATGALATAAELGVSQEDLDDWRSPTLCVDAGQGHQKAGSHEAGYGAGARNALSENRLNGDGVSEDPDPEEQMSSAQGRALALELMDTSGLTPREHAVITILFLEEKGVLRAGREIKMGPNTVLALRDSALAKMRAQADALPHSCGRDV